jgi:hypothetical protein
MPTARELLDQADALMRRNRKRGKGGLTEANTLTDALDTGRDMLLAPTLILPDAQAGEADPIAFDANPGEPAAAPPLHDTDAMPLDTLADVPVLTDVVLEWPPDERAEIEVPGAPPLPSTQDGEAAASDAIEPGDAFPASAADAEAAAAELPPPAVLEREADDAQAASDGAPSDAAVHANEPPPPTIAPRVPFLDDDFILEIPPVDARETPAPPAPVPVAMPQAPATARGRDWDAMSEEIRMQVLQRLDLLTDTGLREQLGARLAPIVERASAQLIETINRELGELVRGYVAEAIEREIDSWRNRNATPGSTT